MFSPPPPISLGLLGMAGPFPHTDPPGLPCPSGHLPSAAQLAHIPLRMPEPSQALPPLALPPATTPGNSLGQTAGPAGAAEAPLSASPLTVCDTGEILPARLQQSLREFKFVELHWFLLTPLLQSVMLKEEGDNPHCCCRSPHEKHRRKTVEDIFTWLLCFNRYTAALCKLYPGMLPHMMSYSNTVVQAYLQFHGDGWRIYDRAFRTQAASRRTMDWTSADPSLYARLVACQSRRATICQF